MSHIKSLSTVDDFIDKFKRSGHCFQFGMIFKGNLYVTITLNNKVIKMSNDKNPNLTLLDLFVMINTVLDSL